MGPLKKLVNEGTRAAERSKEAILYSLLKHSFRSFVDRKKEYPLSKESEGERRRVRRRENTRIQASAKYRSNLSLFSGVSTELSIFSLGSNVIYKRIINFYLCMIIFTLRDGVFSLSLSLCYCMLMIIILFWTRGGWRGGGEGFLDVFLRNFSALWLCLQRKTSEALCAETKDVQQHLHHRGCHRADAYWQ